MFPSLLWYRLEYLLIVTGVTVLSFFSYRDYVTNSFIPIGRKGQSQTSWPDCAQIDWSMPELHHCIIIITCAPIIWNTIARTIYYYLPTSTTRTKRYLICYVLALWIACFSSYRNYTYNHVIQLGGRCEVIYSNMAVRYLAILIFFTGQTFAAAALLKLGISGTCMGDHCGILMTDRVTGFPFSWLTHPMYTGTSMMFIGMGICEGSTVGCLLAIWVCVMYILTSKFEGAFTDAIYANAASKEEVAANRRHDRINRATIYPIQEIMYETDSSNKSAYIKKKI